jgi:hypothetical protein
VTGPAPAVPAAPAAAGHAPAARHLDPLAAGAYLTRLHEGRPFELRVLLRRRGRVLAGYFDDVGAAVRALTGALARRGAREVKGVYTTLNRIAPDLLGRVYDRLEEFPAAATGDRDVTAYRHLLVDVDPVRPAETSSTDAQLAAALGARDRLVAFLVEDLGWPAPLAWLMTGNGGAAVFRLAPLPNDARGEASALVRAALEALQRRFGTAAVTIDTSVFNPARITKVPGTFARKGDDTPRQPHRMARVEGYGSEAAGAGAGEAGEVGEVGEVTPAQLRVLAGLSDPPSGTATAAGAVAGASGAGAHATKGRPPARTWTVAGLLDAAGIRYRAVERSDRTVYRLNRCLTSTAHEDGAAILEFADGKVIYRCQHESCAAKTWRDVREQLGLGGRAGPTLAPPTAAPPPAGGVGGPPDDGAPLPGPGDAPAGRGRGRPVPPGRPGAAGPADGLEPWGDPVPLEAGPGAADLPPWPAGVLPEALQAYAAGVAESYQVPVDLVALSLLGVLAIAVQRKAQVEPQPDWTEQLALWACPIGESGSRRSAVLARVAAPLQRYEAERRAREQQDADASESALRLAREDLLRAERDKSRAADALAKARATPTVSVAERDALQQALQAQQRRVADRLKDVRAAEAALVKPPRLLIEDATVEAASTVLAEQGERLGIVSAEGDFFENLGGRFGKQVPVSFWAKTYTGDRHVVDRRGGGGADGTRPRTEVLERPCLSMVLSPQPVVLGELRDRKTLLLRKGIMARFVYAVPASRVGYRALHPEALRGDVEQPWHATVGRLLALEYAPGVGAVTARGAEGQGLPHRLRCTEAALAVLDAFRADVERRLRPGGDLAPLGEWAHKYVGHVVRIAALLHLAAAAPAAPAAGAPVVLPPVSADAVARAVALAPYLAAHARAALGLFADAARTQGALVLKAWLEAHPRREFGQRDAHQACRRHFDGPDAVADALDVLEAYGYVQDVPPPPGQATRWGRPKRRRLVTNPRWLPDPPDSAVAAAPDAVSPPIEYAEGTFENVLSTGANGSLPDSGRTFEYAEYGEYAPHGGVPAGVGPAPDGGAAADGAAAGAGDRGVPPRTQRTQRTQKSPYQEETAPPRAYSVRPQKSPERPQTSDPPAAPGIEAGRKRVAVEPTRLQELLDAGVPRAEALDLASRAVATTVAGGGVPAAGGGTGCPGDASPGDGSAGLEAAPAPGGPEDEDDGPFAGRSRYDPARVAYGAARRRGFPFLRLRGGRTFGPGEGAWWRDVGRAEGERDAEALYRVARHFELGDEDGTAGASAGGR